MVFLLDYLFLFYSTSAVVCSLAGVCNSTFIDAGGCIVMHFSVDAGGCILLSMLFCSVCISNPFLRVKDASGCSSRD